MKKIILKTKKVAGSLKLNTNYNRYNFHLENKGLK